jgi:hypothetical protein
MAKETGIIVKFIYWLRPDFASITMFIVLAPLLLCGYWIWIDRSEPMRITDSYAVDVDGNRINAVHAGDVIRIVRAGCAKDLGVAMTTRRLVAVSGATLVLEGSNMSRSTRYGCGDITHLIHIPRYTPVGRWTYVVTMTMERNPLRDVTIELPPVSFEVLPPK